MPPKARKKADGKTLEHDGKENESYVESVEIFQLDYNIVKIPALKMEKIIEQGCGAAMADLCATFSSAADWLHEQKDKMKDLVREVSGSKAVPKTPRRGKTFASIRETALIYRTSVPSVEFHDGPNIIVRSEVEEITSTCENRSILVETRTQNSCKEQINKEREMAVCEDVETLGHKQVELSGRTSDEYISATETSELQIPVGVKLECDSPTTMANSVSTFVSPNTNAHMKDFHIKEEYSSNEPATTSNVFDAGFEAGDKMVSHSSTREKAPEVETSTAKQGSVKWAKTKREQVLFAAASVQEELDNRVAAGASQTRLQRTAHQHIVTTPCKREYKMAVQRVMDEQDMARNSGNRAVMPTTDRVNTMPNTAVTAIANPKLPVSKEKLKALRREKEDLAAQLREEQCKERAERIRKEREEKAFRAQRRREQKEIEERLKAEAIKQKEIRDERRREEIRLQKSPARSKVASRVVSPARVPRHVTTTEVRAGSKVLFPCTPGRAPSKLAKVLLSPGGETSKKPTMNTPSRETRRKQCIVKKNHVNSEDSLERDSVSPLRALTSRQEFLREERQRIMREEQVRQERLHEEERRRMKAHEEKTLVKPELHDVKKGTSDTQSVLPEEGRLSKREEVKECMFEEEEEHKILADEKTQSREEVDDIQLRKHDDDVEVLQEDGVNCMGEHNELLEDQLREVIEEEKENVVAVEKKEEAMHIEEEKVLQRLNISSSIELNNRHLENVSEKTPTATHKLTSLHSSYEITPDKVLKPSSENNYNIEDLSSGDETDQEDAPRKKVPSWAEGNELRRALEKQSAMLRSRMFDPNEYFGEIIAPDLALIFGTSKRYPRRGSSGIWDSPISKPRQGIGAFQNGFIKK